MRASHRHTGHYTCAAYCTSVRTNSWFLTAVRVPLAMTCRSVQSSKSLFPLINTSAPPNQSHLMILLAAQCSPQRHVLGGNLPVLVFSGKWKEHLSLATTYNTVTFLGVVMLSPHHCTKLFIHNQLKFGQMDKFKSLMFIFLVYFLSSVHHLNET